MYTCILVSWYGRLIDALILYSNRGELVRHVELTVYNSKCFLPVVTHQSHICTFVFIHSLCSEGMTSHSLHSSVVRSHSIAAISYFPDVYLPRIFKCLPGIKHRTAHYFETPVVWKVAHWTNSLLLNKHCSKCPDRLVIVIMAMLNLGFYNLSDHVLFPPKLQPSPEILFWHCIFIISNLTWPDNREYHVSVTLLRWTSICITCLSLVGWFSCRITGCQLIKAKLYDGVLRWHNGTTCTVRLCW